MKRRRHCAHWGTANRQGMTLKRLRDPSFLRKNTGFTLMEMVMTITIMGVMAGVATYYWPSSLGSATGALQLENDIRATQVYAVSKGVDHQISTTGTNGNAYTFRDEGGQVITRVLDNTDISTFFINYKARVGDPRNVDESPFTGDLTITLTPSGGNPLTDGRKIMVAANTGAVWLP